jgi:hypothetical protein
MLLGELGPAGWDWMIKAKARDQIRAYEKSESVKALSTRTIRQCPVAGCQDWTRARKREREYRADSLVMHLNDYHYWDCEKIAQWLESEGL